MSGSFRTKQISPISIRLKTSLDSLAKKSKSCNNKIDFGFTKVDFSMGKPYKFPQYKQAYNTSYFPSSHCSSLKKQQSRIQKIQKLENILLQKNYKFKRACNMSYKSQKSQRFQKTQVAFEDLQQIQSVKIKRFIQQNDETIKLQEAKKLYEILEDKRLNQTIFVSKEAVSQRKTPIRLRDNFKKNYFVQQQCKTSPTKNHINEKNKNKNISVIHYLNKTSQNFYLSDQNLKISPWNVESGAQDSRV